MWETPVLKLSPCGQGHPSDRERGAGPGRVQLAPCAHFSEGETEAVQALLSLKLPSQQLHPQNELPFEAGKWAEELESLRSEPGMNHLCP